MTGQSSNSKKRRFQASITSYFPTTDSGQHVSHHNYSAPTNTPTPALPHTIQSSLLAVGMRVRKAVPEGYKTSAMTSKLDGYTRRAIYSPSATASTATTTTTAELLPFCGMFKVGNLAVQTYAPGDEDEGFFPSSQDSTTSSVALPNPHKRGLQVDVDSDIEDEQLQQQHTMSTTMFPGGGGHSLRPILTPRLGQRNRQARPHDGAKASRFQHISGGGGYWGQENQEPAPHQFADFEDATFLRRREEVDDEFDMIIPEVEMGGV